MPDPDQCITCLVLPRRLHLLKVPYWMFLLSKAQPGTVIDKFHPTGEYKWNQDWESARLVIMHTRQEIVQNMSNVTIGCFRLVSSVFMDPKMHQFFDWGMSFAEDATLVVRCQDMPSSFVTLMKTCWARPGSAIIARFHRVEIEQEGTCAELSAQVHRSSIGVLCNEQDISAVSAIRIYSRKSKRGACTLRHRPDYEMFDIEWDDRPYGARPFF